MKIKISSLFLLIFLVLSCENPDSNSLAEKDYCGCITNSIDSNSISYLVIDSLKTECFRKIVTEKYHLNNDSTFIKTFAKNEVEIDSLAKRKLLRNIGDLLIKYNWNSSDSWNEEWRRLSFDGKMFTWNTTSFGQYSRNIYDDSETGTYEIELNSNGSTYITITGGSNEAIFKLITDKGSFVLQGNHSYISEPKNAK